MQQPITRAQHGAIDWAYVPAVAAAPSLAKFSGDSTPARLARIVSGTALASTLFTRFEAGLVRIIPFKVHLGLDVAMSALALGAPWLFGFAKDARARNTFVGIGLLGLVVGALTQPKDMPRDAPLTPFGRG